MKPREVEVLETGRAGTFMLRVVGQTEIDRCLIAGGASGKSSRTRHSGGSLIGSDPGSPVVIIMELDGNTQALHRSVRRYEHRTGTALACLCRRTSSNALSYCRGRISRNYLGRGSARYSTTTDSAEHTGTTLSPLAFDNVAIVVQRVLDFPAVIGHLNTSHWCDQIMATHRRRMARRHNRDLDLLKLRSPLLLRPSLI